MMKRSTMMTWLFLLIAGAFAPAAAQPGDGQKSAASAVETISVISFTGNDKFSDAQLLEATGLRVGGAMSQEIIGEAIDRLVAYYRQAGANLSVSPNITPNNGAPIIEFVIDEDGTRGNAGAFEPGNDGRAGGAPPGGDAAEADGKI